MDKRHGQGTMYEGINYYEGQWKNDKIHGSGIYKKSGTKIDNFWTAKATWTNDESKNAIVTYRNKEKYIGYFDIKLGRHGDGKMFYKDGTVYVGHWYRDSKDGIGVLYPNRKAMATEGMELEITSQKHKPSQQIWKQGKIVQSKCPGRTEIKN